MPRSNVIRYGVIPALITIPLTALRAWLEVNHPGETITKLVSLNIKLFVKPSRVPEDPRLTPSIS